MRVPAVLLVASLMVGCASQSLYDWGDYDELLYQSYKNPAAAEELKVALEARVAAADKAGAAGQRRVPPGIYAELGTLYLQEGDTGAAIAMYEREREAWPESRGLMDALISNLQRIQADQGATKQ